MSTDNYPHYPESNPLSTDAATQPDVEPAAGSEVVYVRPLPEATELAFDQLGLFADSPRPRRFFGLLRRKLPVVEKTRKNGPRVNEDAYDAYGEPVVSSLDFPSLEHLHNTASTAPYDQATGRLLSRTILDNADDFINTIMVTGGSHPEDDDTVSVNPALYESTTAVLTIGRHRAEKRGNRLFAMAMGIGALVAMGAGVIVGADSHSTKSSITVVAPRYEAPTPEDSSPNVIVIPTNGVTARPKTSPIHIPDVVPVNATTALSSRAPSYAPKHAATSVSSIPTPSISPTPSESSPIIPTKLPTVIATLPKPSSSSMPLPESEAPTPSSSPSASSIKSSADSTPTSSAS